MPDNLNEWGRRLDAGETGDPELQLAARLRAARPSVSPLPSRTEVEMRERVLNGAPSRTTLFPTLPHLNVGWWVATAFSAFVLIVISATFYVLAQPTPAFEPTSVVDLPSPTPRTTEATPDFAATAQANQFDQVTIVSTSPGPGTLLPNTAFGFEVTVIYTLTTAPTATLQIAFADPAWDGEWRSGRLPWEGGSEITVTADQHTATVRFQFRPNEELKQISQDGQVALYVSLNHIDEHRQLSRLDYEVSRGFRYPLSGLLVPVAAFTPGVTPFPPTATSVPVAGAGVGGRWLTPRLLDLWGEGFLGPLAVSPDGSTLAVGTSLGLEFYAAPTLERLRIVSLASSTQAVAFSADGGAVAVGGSGGGLWLLDAQTGAVLAELRGHTGSVTSLAFSGRPAGLLVSGSVDGTVRVWAVDTGAPIAVLTGHTGSVTAVAFSPQANLLVSAGEDKRIQVWSIVDGPAIVHARTLIGHTNYIVALAFNPSDGLTLASTSNRQFQDQSDDPIRLWNVETGQQVRTMQLSASGATALAFSPDGRTLAAVALSRQPNIRLWEVESGKYLRNIEGRGDGVTSLAFSPDDRTLYTTSSWDQTVRAWDAVERKELRTTSQRLVLTSAVAFSHSGQTFATSDRAGLISLWDVGDHSQPLRTLGGLSDIVNRMAFSPDGRQLAAFDIQGHLFVWETTTGRVLRTDRIPGGGYSFETDPNSLGLFVSPNIVTWLPLSAELPQPILDQLSSAASLSLSPDGRWLAIGYYDQAPAIVEITTGQVRLALDDSVTAIQLAFSADGRFLFTSGWNEPVRQWKAATGELVRVIENTQAGRFALSPDGRILATSDARGVISLWDSETGEQVGAVAGYASGAWTMAFSSDGRRLLTAGDGVVKAWGVP